MSTQEKELFKDKTKAEYYIQHGRKKWGDLYKSIRHFLEKTDLKGEKVLEVGCAAGGMSAILKEKFGKVDYTGFDISPLELKHARKTYPESTFVAGDFTANKFKDGQFDTVMSWQVLNHNKDYKKFISELFRVAKKRVMFDTSVRYEGSTVTDIDLSYVYYHGSGKRNHHLIFNFYELLNLLNIEQFGAKKISIYGYYPPDKTSAFVPMPKSKIVIAAFCIEKEDPATAGKRWGARTEFVGRDWCKLDIQLPDFSMNDV